MESTLSDLDQLQKSQQNSQLLSDLQLNYVTEITLKNFRNFEQANFSFAEKPVIICGENGKGKTNLLEAISLLAPGKGLRGAEFKDILNHEISQNETWPKKWQISANIVQRENQQNFDQNKIEVNTIFENPDLSPKRSILLNSKKIKTIGSLSQFFNVNWLTPQMDHLFLGAASERRKFFDRLVFGFFSNHATLLSSHEKQMQERMKILKNAKENSKTPSDSWLKIVEEKMSELAIDIIENRRATLKLLNYEIENVQTNFPKAEISLMLKSNEPLNLAQAMSSYTENLKSHRSLDMATGRTNFGVHRLDMNVKMLSTQVPAINCSTGQQKSLLISIVLANLRAIAKTRPNQKKGLQNGAVPIMLLDEVVAHLDAARREELFEQIIALGIQAWITGTDKEIFSAMTNHAEFLQF